MIVRVCPTLVNCLWAIIIIVFLYRTYCLCLSTVWLIAVGTAQKPASAGRKKTFSDNAQIGPDRRGIKSLRNLTDY